MKIYSDSKIYVLCPGNHHTGGCEVLHQLCSILRHFNFDAYMFYINCNPQNPVDPFYRKYHVPYVLKVEDAPHNILVIYEVIGTDYFLYNRIQKIFWWLSADNFINNAANLLAARKGKALGTPLPKFFYFQPEEKKTRHWVQSEYARQFVLLNGVSEKNLNVVEDYLNQAFLSRAAHIDLSLKENIVAFNPQKGFEVTRQLIHLAPDLKWAPIQQMTPAQVQNLLARSKVYVDFGNHPGKDRIPREAAISGCVVITGKRGAAGNDVDINIPREFKFDETPESLNKIIEKISSVFENFSDAYDKQKPYRDRILNDKIRFENEVADAFNLKSSEKFVTAALWQGYSNKSYSLLQILEKNNFAFTAKFIVDDRLGNGQMVNGEYITRKNNSNYFGTTTMGGGIPFISEDDAKFLYLEGRINKFILFVPDDSEITALFEKIQPLKNDVLIINLED